VAAASTCTLAATCQQGQQVVLLLLLGLLLLLLLLLLLQCQLPLSNVQLLLQLVACGAGSTHGKQTVIR
jgi:hypothetical protein